MKAIIEYDSTYVGYVLYRCPKCRHSVYLRKLGEPLKRESIYCEECGVKVDLKRNKG